MPGRLKTKTQRECKLKKKSKSNIHTNPSHRTCILQASPLIPKSSSSHGSAWQAKARVSGWIKEEAHRATPPLPQCSGQSRKGMCYQGHKWSARNPEAGTAFSSSALSYYLALTLRLKDTGQFSCSFPPYVIFRKANLDNSKAVTHRLPHACPQRRDS